MFQLLSGPSFKVGSDSETSWKVESIRARIYRPSFHENKPKKLVFSHTKRAFWACFRENWVCREGLFLQNIPKESTLNPEKDSSIKRPRSHVSLEKLSQNYKPLENWAKPNLPTDVTPQPANSFGECIRQVSHVVKPEPREFLAILSSQRNWPRTGERAGLIAVWSSSVTGW